MEGKSLTQVTFNHLEKYIKKISVFIFAERCERKTSENEIKEEEEEGRR